jgi:translation initiation factor 2B subunit (eIF-2B alpha/beta/delta family)
VFCFLPLLFVRPDRLIFPGVSLWTATLLAEFQELATDNTSGATELVRKLLALCENCAIGYCFDDIEEGFALLEQSQKSMPSLHAVLHILKSEFLPRLRKDDQTADAIAYISSLEKILSESGTAITELFLTRFSAPVRCVTLSRSSTVLASLRKLNEHGLLTQVFVLEARPMLEGHRTIRDLDDNGISATLLTDAAMGVALSKVDFAVVGADSISADGYLLNKTGTLPLAICCKEFGVPLYVLSDSLKFSPQLREDIVVEQRQPDELIVRSEKDHFSVWNRYFEWTPVEYIKEFITERGAFAPDQLSALAGDEGSALEPDIE